MLGQEVVTEKKVKVPKVAKEPRFRKGLNAEQWATKLASMTKTDLPEGYLGMAEIVKAARGENIKTSRICTAMGGDRGMSEPWDPIFQVTYVGGRKFGSPDILTKGFALLKDPEYHKAVHKGRPHKEKIEMTGEAGKKVHVNEPKKSVDPVWKG